jgi:hypothetical protein
MITADQVPFCGITAAKALGYRPLTGGYQMPAEKRMLENVLADMRRGNIDHVVVGGRTGVAVWRKGSNGAKCGLENSSPLPPAGVLKSGRRKSARRGVNK